MPPSKKTPGQGAEKSPPLARAKMGTATQASLEPEVPLAERFLTKLKESALADKEIVKKLAFEPMEAGACAKLGLNRPAAGFRIPYWNIDGTPSGFFRFRYLEDPRTGFAKLTGKVQRYGQVKGTVNEAYFPPVLNWKAVVKDVSQTVWVTEGELKAACGCVHGIPVIGLGGVWVWRAGKQLVDLLPQLQAFEWDGRPVAICFDSDAATNPNVMAAEDALASKLTELGAHPRIVRLPGEGTKKIGLDDFIVANSAEELQFLFDTSEEYKRAKALHQLNLDVCYIRDPGFVLVRDTMQLMTPGAFTDHQYANRFHLVLDGEKAKKVPTAAAWLRWEHRSEVQKLTYAPGKEQIFRSERGELMMNSWKGWGCEAAPGPVALWNELMEHMFPGNQEPREWFERWLAYPIQNPGAKLATAAVIWGRLQGTGKSLIGYAMRKIYGENFVEIQNQDLAGTFTGWAKDRQFIMGEEITGGEGMGSRKMADRMKGYITQQLTKINIKGIPEYFLPDCSNFYFTSNHPDCFYLEDSDRRFFIHEAPEVQKSPEWYTKFAQWLEIRPEYVTEEQRGPRALRHYFETLPMGDFNPVGRAPDTKAKATMVMDGQSDIGAWIRRVMTSPETYLRTNGVPMPYTLYTPHQLLAAYDIHGAGRVSVNGVSRELRKAGVQCVGEWTTANGRYELWNIRARPAPNDGDWGLLFDMERAVGAANGSKHSVTPRKTKQPAKAKGK